MTILIYNALGEHDIRWQVIQYNCIYRILTLYRMTIHVNCLQHLSSPEMLYTYYTYISVRMQIFRVCSYWASCAKLNLRTTARRLSAWIFGRVLLSYQSVVMLPQVKRWVLCFTWTECCARDGARPTTASGIKRKFVKWYVSRTVLREQARGLNEKPAKGNDVKQRKHKEGGKQSAWLKP